MCFRGDLVVKKSACQRKGRRLDPWVRKTLKGNATHCSILLAGEFHAQWGLGLQSTCGSKSWTMSPEKEIQTTKDPKQNLGYGGPLLAEPYQGLC